MLPDESRWTYKATVRSLANVETVAPIFLDCSDHHDGTLSTDQRLAASQIQITRTIARYDFIRTTPTDALPTMMNKKDLLDQESADHGLALGRAPTIPEARTTVNARWSRWISRLFEAPNWGILVRWYFMLMLVSVTAKYFSTPWGDLLHVTRPRQGVLGYALVAFELITRVFSVYRVDVIETWLILLGLVITGHLVGRIRLALIAAVSLTVAVLVALGCWVALWQTGMPLTKGTVLIAVNWGVTHPEVIPTVLPFRTMFAAISVALAYGFLSILATNPDRLPNRFNRALTYAVSALAFALTLASTLLPGRRLPSFTNSMSPVEGYWSAVLAALTDRDRESPLVLHAPSRSELLRQYYGVAYPRGRPRSDSTIDMVPAFKNDPHIVIVALETAPNAYYPITRDSTFQTFSQMSLHSIVSAHHLTTRTYTLLAIYGILTGTYPRPGNPIGEFGSFHNDGLASTLGKRGYETSYIDSFKIDWGYHYRAELLQQGFSVLLDSSGTSAGDSHSFEEAVAKEHWSLGHALRRLAAAKSRHKKAFVVVATTLGHFPWRSPPESAGAPSSQKVYRIAKELDLAVGGLIRGIDSLGLKDSVIVVVTGDHGLRYKAEYASFGDSPTPSNADFNVPFLLYAPGAISHRIDLPFPTSHVDIAPTIYALLGLSDSTRVLHGENMLNARLSGRATYLMNTGLNPNDGFQFKGHRFQTNEVTHTSSATPALSESTGLTAGWVRDSVPVLVNNANHVFNLTAAYFLAKIRR